MTTPADNTPQSIITDAMKDAGLIMRGQIPNSDQLAEGMRRLRDVIRTFQTTGLKLFVNEDITVSLVAGVNTYTFGTLGTVPMDKPLRVLDGYYKYTTNNVRRPLLPLAWADYVRLGQVGTATANQGAVTQYFVNKQATLLNVTLWLCPSEEEADNGEVHLIMQTQIDNPNKLNEQTAFPEEWRMALRWNLAEDWCTGQPVAVQQRCAQNAMKYREMLEAWDVEDAPTIFTPDTRMGYSTAGFR